MAQTRSELRITIMNILYQIEILKASKVDYTVDAIIKDNLSVDSEFVKEIVYGVTTYLTDIDTLANKYLDEWSMNRLDKIGAAILRMAIFEIKYYDTPQLVAINEAIELAKKYCDEKVKNMINAVLDKVIKE